ncbi:MAG: tRNA uridine(34) 5-carboxymethylaminomethyl modification radical SAM/GNAT enzyme Elp3 [Candidatus Micrarchaeota archaeon]
MREKAVLYCVKLLPRIKSKRELEKLRRASAEKFGLSEPVRCFDVFNALNEKEKEKYAHLLKTRFVKSASGVTVVAVMTAPMPCPGKCWFCPPSILAAKSYTGFEPAALRSRQNNFDARLQVLHRLKQLTSQGHNPEKCEVIIMGGTFNSLPLDYQHSFVKGVYDGFNGFISNSVDEAVQLNEKARYRVIGLTFETRPDWINEKFLNEFLSFGGTRLEIGVQSLNDAVLKKVERGHGVKEVVQATRLAKEKFFKVCYHFMPGLYSTKEKDVEMFKRLFSDERFKPDMIKIYPCLVVPGARLFQEWKQGRFKPYGTKEAVDVVSECMRFVPEYCRVMRINRDIPVTKIADGVVNSNLRQLVDAECDKKGIELRDIRSREIGLAKKKISKTKLNRIDYEASNGKELFLSIDSGKDLVGFLRLRVNEDERVGVRELRVFGEQVNIGKKVGGAVQHHSFGKKLLSEAERIALEEFDARKLFVISGVGVREYYSRQGYYFEKPYMVKELS